MLTRPLLAGVPVFEVFVRPRPDGQPGLEQMPVCLVHRGGEPAEPEPLPAILRTASNWHIVEEDGSEIKLSAGDPDRRETLEAAYRMMGLGAEEGRARAHAMEERVRQAQREEEEEEEGSYDEDADEEDEEVVEAGDLMLFDRLPARVEMSGRNEFSISWPNTGLSSWDALGSALASEPLPSQPAVPLAESSTDPAAVEASFKVSIAESGAAGGDQLDVAQLRSLESKDVRVDARLSQQEMADLGLSESDVQRLSQGIADATLNKVQEVVAQAERSGEAISRDQLARVIGEAVESVFAERLPQPQQQQEEEEEEERLPAALEGLAAASSSPSTSVAASVLPLRLAAERRCRYERISGGEEGDPLQGLFIGTFGPHGPELLQMRRGMDEDGDEAVVAEKLTGDPNVPCGKLSFKAKVGRKHRASPAGVYPDEMAIVGRYRGFGRVAQQGYTDSHWVDGDLLVFSGSEYTGSAELGFVWQIPRSRAMASQQDKKFLILLNRVFLD